MADSVKLEWPTLERGDKIWVPSIEHGWVHGEIDEVKTGNYVIRTEYGFVVMKPGRDSSLQVVKEDGNPFGSCTAIYRFKSADLENPPDDLTNISDLHEASILGCLRTRYANSKIYTNVGMILLALNPWQRVPHLYDQAAYKTFENCALEQAPPHLYKVAEEAYTRLLSDQQSQAILVSGESGAGKTESCKYIMKYIGDRASGGHATDIAERIMQSNPILEAFGNAKTSLNNNSSRFGKFVKILFDKKHAVLGATIETYLLEKSRVVSQAKSDRNYHIFYQLLSTSDQNIIRDSKLRDFSFYRYLVSEDHIVDDVDDADEFKTTQNAMKSIGITEAEQKSIFRFLSGILYLGNIQFVANREGNATLSPSEENGMTSEECLSHACALLQIDEETVKYAFLGRRIVVSQVTTERKYNVPQAEESRDSFAKYIYSRIFEWILKKINENLEPPKKIKPSEQFIGLLDISGFESFKVNGLEQLCINYSNERIQQIFNNHVFKWEQELYKAEKIEWEHIAFTDNNEVLDFIESDGKKEKPLGLIGSLNDASKNAAGTDETFLNAMIKNHPNSSVLSQNRLDRKKFNINHFAGEVEYTSTGFRDRNADNVHNDLITSLMKSKDDLMTKLIPASEIFRNQKTPQKGTGQANALTGESIISAFKSQLDSLANVLAICNRYFVRCIKPNIEKKPNLFIGHEVARQLRYGGVVTAVGMILKMYPSKIDTLSFYKKYTEPHEWKCFLSHRKFTPPIIGLHDTYDTIRVATGKLCQAMGLKPITHYQIGRSKIFFRAAVLPSLDQKLQSFIRNNLRKVLRKYRLYREAKRLYAIKMVQSAIRSYLLEEELRKIAAMRILKFFRRVRARGALFRLIIIKYREKQQLKKLNTDIVRDILRQRRYHVFISRLSKTVKSIIAIQAAFRGRRVRKHIRIEKGLGIHQKLVGMKEENEALKVKVSDLENNLIEKKSALEASNRANSHLEAEMKIYKDQISQLEKHLHASKTESAQLREQNTALRNDIITLNGVHDSYKKSSEVKIKNLEALNEQNKAHIAEKEKQISDLSAQLTEKISTGASTKESLTRVITLLQAKLKAISQGFGYQKADISREVEQMLIEYENFVKPKIKILETALEQSWVTISELKEEIGEFKESISQKDNIIDLCQGGITKLEGKLADEQAITRDLRQQISTLEATVRSQKADIDSKKLQIQTLITELEQKQEALIREKKRMDQMREENRRLKVQNEGSVIQFDYIQDYGIIEKPVIIPKDSSLQTKAIASRFGVKASLNAVYHKSRLGFDSSKAVKIELEGPFIRIYNEKHGQHIVEFYIEDSNIQIGGETASHAQSSRNLPQLSNVVYITHQTDKYEYHVNDIATIPQLTNALSINSLVLKYVKSTVQSRTCPDPRILALYGKDDVSSIVLDGTPLVFDSAVALGDAISDKCVVTDLSIRYAMIDSPLLQGIQKRASHRFAHLKKLLLSHNKIDDSSIGHLVTILEKSKQLTHLDLSDNPLTDRASAYIGKLLKQNTTLTELVLTQTKIGNETVRAIHESVSGITPIKLNALYLGKNAIDHLGAKSIASILTACRSITAVYLQDNFIGADGCISIADALPKSAVKTLNIANNQIDHSGVVKIVELLSSKSSELADIVLDRCNADTVTVFKTLDGDYSIQGLGFRKY